MDPNRIFETIYARIDDGSLLAPVAAAIAECEKCAPPKSVAVTEWNLWTHMRQYRDGLIEPPDGAHLMFVANMQHAMFRLAPRLELINYYALLNPMGLVLAYGRTIEITAIARLMRWYRDLLPGALLPTRADNAFLDAVAVRHDDVRTVIAINRSAIEPVHLSLDDLGRASDIQTIHAAHADAIADVGDRHPLTDPGPISLPPLSVSRITL